MSKLIPFLIVASLLASCVGFFGFSPWSQIQDESCVFFIQDPLTSRELWFWCEGQDPKVFLEGFRDITNYAVAGDGRAIYFIQTNNSGGADLWTIENQKATPQRLMGCTSPLCGDLAINATANILAFSDFEDEPALKLLDLENSKIEIFSYHANDLEFSPDGKYLGFFDRNKSQLVVLDILNGKTIAVDSQEGLTGGWSSDSQQILYGAVTFQEEIPGINVIILTVSNGQTEWLGSEISTSLEFYQPQFFQSAEFFIAAVRDRSFGLNRQLWVYNRNGEPEHQITSDYNYDNSAFHVNRKQAQILFQRFTPNTPNSQPEIWMVDLESNELELIARNATNPQWVYFN